MREQEDARELELLLGGPLFHNSPIFAQASFRWRNDDGSETTATWKAAADTDITVDLSGGDVPIRIRFLIQETNNGSANGVTFNLNQRKNGGTWGTVFGTTPFDVRNSANLTDGADTTQQLGSGTFISSNAGVIEAATGASVNFSGLDEVEVEFSLNIRSDVSLVDGDTIDLRLDPSDITTYTVTHARVTISLPTVTNFVAGSTSPSAVAVAVKRTAPMVSASISPSAGTIAIIKQLSLSAASSSPSGAAALLAATRPLIAASLSDSSMTAALGKVKAFIALADSPSAMAATIQKTVGIAAVSVSPSAMVAAIIKSLVLSAVSNSISSVDALLVATRPLAGVSDSPSNGVVLTSVSRALALASNSASSVVVNITVTTGGVTRTFALVCDSASAASIVETLTRNMAVISGSDSIINANIIESKSFSSASNSPSAMAVDLYVPSFTSAGSGISATRRRRRF